MYSLQTHRPASLYLHRSLNLVKPSPLEKAVIRVAMEAVAEEESAQEEGQTKMLYKRAWTHCEKAECPGPRSVYDTLAYRPFELYSYFTHITMHIMTDRRHNMLALDLCGFFGRGYLAKELHAQTANHTSLLLAKLPSNPGAIIEVFDIFLLQ